MKFGKKTIALIGAVAISSPTIHTEAYGDVPAIDAVVTLSLIHISEPTRH